MWQTMGSNNEELITCEKCGTKHNKNNDCMKCRYGEPIKDYPLTVERDEKMDT